MCLLFKLPNTFCFSNSIQFFLKVGTEMLCDCVPLEAYLGVWLTVTTQYFKF